ncbi:MAG: alanine--tRNA ligase [Micrococcaceae bacterium]
MKSYEIKKRWLDFFESKGHKTIPSASLVSEDPALLFTVAGMVPFIPYMTGEKKPPSTRVASVQKCIRTLDIEEVGKTARHGTFFQMNGNFSFGDYFKKEAIAYAWELLTNSIDDGGYGLDPDRLWVTIYEKDDEALEAWLTQTSIPKERIEKCSMAENFWSTGQPGPAGPDTEIFYDRGEKYGPAGTGPSSNEDRYLEIWNLVFTQYQRGEYKGYGDPKDSFDLLGDLPQKNIDTGLGCERLAFLLQGVDNFYEIDEVYPVLKKASEISGVKYQRTEGKDVLDTDVKLRVVADHVRSALMLISDGVVPSNEGRGYVLRRLLRRVVRSMRLLGVNKATFPELFPASMEAMKPSYPELEENFDKTSKIAYKEERVFLRTIAAGSNMLDEVLTTAKKENKPVSGKQAFALHDTYGFPLDLTLEAASEAGLKVDEKGFKDLMQEQKERARRDAQAKKTGHVDLGIFEKIKERGESEFKGYETLETDSHVKALLVDGKEVDTVEEGQKVQLVLDQTPFYAEAGGQSADHGLILGDNLKLAVSNVQRPVKGVIVHDAVVKQGELRLETNVAAKVDPDWRLEARQAHSGTHIVHAALREILGPDATQSGSFNKPGYLRLDYKWNEALSPETKSEIEEVSNKAIRNDLKVWDEYMSMDEAKDRGALALFGETYDDIVRVVTVGGPWSVELCGGTHVDHSSQVGSLAITGENSVGSGARRIEAFVGFNAFQHLALERSILHNVTQILKTKPEKIEDNIVQLMDKLKQSEKELAKFRKESAAKEAAEIAQTAKPIGGFQLVTKHLGQTQGNTAREIVNMVRDRLSNESAVIVITAENKGRPSIIVATTEEARNNGAKAGQLVRVAAPVLGGKGGGRDDMAQGGGADVTAVDKAFAAVESELSK